MLVRRLGVGVCSSSNGRTGVNTSEMPRNVNDIHVIYRTYLVEAQEVEPARVRPIFDCIVVRLLHRMEYNPTYFCSRVCAVEIFVN